MDMYADAHVPAAPPPARLVLFRVLIVVQVLFRILIVVLLLLLTIRTVFSP